MAERPITPRGIERTYGIECFHFLQTIGSPLPKNTDGIQCTRCKQIVVPNYKGRPDYQSTIGRLGAFVEVKGGVDRIEFAQISEDQRSWLDQEQTAKEFRWLSFIFIIIGVDPVNSRSVNARRSWFIPWNTWKLIEEKMKLEEGVAYLPRYYVKGMRMKKREIQLDGSESPFRKYALEWKDSGWHIDSQRLQELIKESM